MSLRNYQTAIRRPRYEARIVALSNGEPLEIYESSMSKRRLKKIAQDAQPWHGVRSKIIMKRIPHETLRLKLIHGVIQ